MCDGNGSLFQSKEGVMGGSQRINRNINYIKVNNLIEEVLQVVLRTEQVFISWIQVTSTKGPPIME